MFLSGITSRAANLKNACFRHVYFLLLGAARIVRLCRIRRKHALARHTALLASFERSIAVLCSSPSQLMKSGYPASEFVRSGLERDPRMLHFGLSSLARTF